MISKEVITPRSRVVTVFSAALFGVLCFALGARAAYEKMRIDARAAYMNGSTMPRPVSVPAYRDVTIYDGVPPLTVKWEGAATLSDSTLTFTPAIGYATNLTLIGTGDLRD